MPAVAEKIKLKPLGSRVVIKALDREETTKSGIFLPDTAKEKPQEGNVIAVGNGKILNNGDRVAMDIKVGDRVLFGKYSGTEVKLDGEEYLILREDDVLGVIEGAAKSAKK